MNFCGYGVQLGAPQPLKHSKANQHRRLALRRIAVSSEISPEMLVRRA
jgi:hypothetical protein